MTNTKKQAKITTLFRRGAISTRLPDDCDELQEEVQQLEQELKKKHDELFELQRNSYRRKISPVKRKLEPFARPGKIMATNTIETLKKNQELMSLLTGIEVQSYVAGDHFNIVYHMQHKSEHEVKHGLMIDMRNNEASKMSLPVGFNLTAVLDGHNNFQSPECLVSVRKALVAYYDRLEQFNRLTKLLYTDAQLVKIMDGSHMEITFTVTNEHEEDSDQIEVTLILDYRVYDIRPKQYSFVDIDVPESVIEVLGSQCSVFRNKPLDAAFKEAFIQGNGIFVIVQQHGLEKVDKPRRKQRQPQPVNPRFDDTYHPEDCSGTDDDDNK